jgi:hypothetical protein
LEEKDAGELNFIGNQSKLVASRNYAQEVIYIKKVSDSIEIEINLPLNLKVNNKGVKDSKIN